jgi:peptidoglycan/LPS O-acetylase OafA/YrhL
LICLRHYDFYVLKRIPSLDGLRAVSILLVIAGHWITTHHGPAYSFAYANLGVRIFFVISGFLITTLLLHEEERAGAVSLRGFYIRRAYRIFPAAAVFMLVMFILFRHELRWYEMALAALYLMNFYFGKPWQVGHLWSLGVEEQFYFLWPGIFKKYAGYRAGILIGVMIASPLISLGLYLFHVPAGGYGMFPAVADNLAVGCLLAINHSRMPIIKTWLALLMVMVIALVPAFPATSAAYTGIKTVFLFPLMNVCIAGVLLHTVQRPYWILNAAPITWLGRISYSLYLWQQWFTYNPRPLPWYFLFGALGMACLSYYLVEQPMLRLRDRGRAALHTLPPRSAYAMTGD